MKFVETGDPDILRTRRGGGLALIFGLAFLLTGLLVISLSFDAGDVPWFVPAIFGAVFVALGLVLAFGRSGMIIDRRIRTVVQWSGLLVPFKKTTDLLDYYDRITIQKDLRRGDKRSYYAYPIVLAGKDDAREGIVFDEPTDYPKARRVAEEITRFLKFPLVDTTSGKEVVRKPDKLDESIRERAKRTNEKVRVPTPTLGMRARVLEEGETLIIEIPPQKLTMEHYKQMVVLTLIGIGVAVVFFGVDNLRHLEAYNLMIYSPAVIVMLLFGSRAVLRQTRRSWRITASREVLRVEKRSSNGRRIVEIPVDELEDFVMGDADPSGGISGTRDGQYGAHGVRGAFRNHGRYSDQQSMAGRNLLAKLGLSVHGPSITASSDKATVNFGKGLIEGELHYLYALIKKRITE